jgi:queuosine precursor transporter
MIPRSVFIVSQLLDVAIFNRLRRQSWWKAPLWGSAIASVVDTAIFFSLAFAGTGFDWKLLAAGDLGVKLLMAAALLVPFRALVRRLAPTH